MRKPTSLIDVILGLDADQQMVLLLWLLTVIFVAVEVARCR